VVKNTNVIMPILNSNQIQEHICRNEASSTLSRHFLNVNISDTKIGESGCGKFDEISSTPI